LDYRRPTQNQIYRRPTQSRICRKEDLALSSTCQWQCDGSRRPRKSDCWLTCWQTRKFDSPERKWGRWCWRRTCR
jgi:hypothetical protein